MMRPQWVLQTALVLLGLAAMATGQRCTKTTWSEFSELHVSGGTRQPSGTVAECQAACEAVNDCVAYDHNADNNNCWIITGITISINPIVPEGGVIHYRTRTSCVNTNVDTQCEMVYVGPYVADTSTTVTATDELDCAGQCPDLPGCTGYEWYNDAECRLLTAEVTVDTRTEDSLSQQYIVRACRDVSGICTAESYVEFPAQHVSGGTPMPSGSGSVDSCQAECELDPDCSGFDLRTSDSKCYLILGDVGSNDIVDGDATHYRREVKSCSGVGGLDDCEFLYAGNYYATVNTEEVPDASTEDDCALACTMADNCKGFDYNDAVVIKCELIVEDFSLAQRTEDANTRQFKAFNCSREEVITTPTPSTVPPTTTAAEITTTTNPPATFTPTPPPTSEAPTTTQAPTEAPTTTQAPTVTIPTTVEPGTDGCNEYSYLEYAGQHVSGGTLYGPGVNDHDLCVAGCDAEERCAGFDYQTAEPFGCWLIETVQATSNDIIEEDGVIHARKQARCYALSGQVECDFGSAGSYKADNSMSYSGGTTPSLCGVACSERPSCRAYEWHSTANEGERCRLVSEQLDDSRTYDENVRQFSKFNCSGELTTDLQCVRFAYRKYPDQHVSGGTLTEEGNDVGQCQVQCDNDFQCAAYDYTNSQLCFLIRENQVTINPIIPEEGVEHYRYEGGCVSSDAQKFCQFISAGGYTSEGAVDVVANNHTHCTSQCTDDMTCKAYEWNTDETSGNRCKHVLADLEEDTRSPSNDVEQYARGECYSCPYYREFTDQSVEGALPQSTLTTLDACRNSCTNNLDCWGFDFSPEATGTKCYFHTTPTPTYQSSEGTTNYWLVCRTPDVTSPPDVTTTEVPSTSSTTSVTTVSTTTATESTTTVTTTGPTTQDISTPPPCDDWEFREGMSSSGGVYQQDIDNIRDCQILCNANEDCVAIDIDRDGGTFCYLHLDIVNLENDRETSLVDQYFLLSRCQAACVDNFTLWPNHRSVGGMPFTATSVQQCFSGCHQNSACEGADYHLATSDCNHHNNQATLVARVPDQGWWQAVVNRCP